MSRGIRDLYLRGIGEERASAEGESKGGKSPVSAGDRPRYINRG